MAGLLIDGRVHFALARAGAEAQRRQLERGADSMAVDIEFLEAELRAAMASGGGFESESPQ